MYRAEKKSLQILLSRTQAGPGRKIKQEQKEISRNHVPRLFLGSVQPHFSKPYGTTEVPSVHYSIILMHIRREVLIYQHTSSWFKLCFHFQIVRRLSQVNPDLPGTPEH